MQMAVRERLHDLFRTNAFPGSSPVPFTPAASPKLFNYPYRAVRLPPGTRSLLVLVTVHGRCIAALVSLRLTVTRIPMHTLPQSMFKGTVLDGHLQRADGRMTFHATDCLAFKGIHNRTFSYNQRMIGLMAVVDALRVQSGKQDFDRVAVSAAESLPLHGMPRQGTWIAVPEDLGLRPGAPHPDMYILCMDDLATMLPLD